MWLNLCPPTPLATVLTILTMALWHWNLTGVEFYKGSMSVKCSPGYWVSCLQQMFHQMNVFAAENFSFLFHREPVASVNVLPRAISHFEPVNLCIGSDTLLYKLGSTGSAILNSVDIFHSFQSAFLPTNGDAPFPGRMRSIWHRFDALSPCNLLNLEPIQWSATIVKNNYLLPTYFFITATQKG